MTAPTGWWPQATKRPVSYSPSAGAFPRPPAGWLLHVVVGNGSPWRIFEQATGKSQRFAHLWVAKDGTAEQYAPLSGKAWHAVDGNGAYWGVETEGYPTEPLTSAQLDTLAAWHVYSGTPDVIATAPGQAGIGTHYMGGTAYGGHTCPDPSPGMGPRSRQRAEIIRRAQAIRGDAMPTPEEYAAAVWRHPFPTGPGGEPESAGIRLVNAARGGGLTDDVVAIAAQLAALRAEVHASTSVTLSQGQVDGLAAAVATSVARILPSGTTIDPQLFAVAVANELARRIAN